MTTTPILRTVDDVPQLEVERAVGATIQVLLGPEEGMPRFYTRRFTLAPGGRIPAHRHPNIEHEQLMLSGQMRVTLDGEERVVRAGQVLFIPPRVTHAYANDGPEPARFLCIVPASASYETEWL